MEKLALRNPFRFNTGFDRPNLHLSVREVESKPAWITENLAKLNASGIVYAPTRRETLETARAISGTGGSADFYHAGLEVQARERKQRDWTEGRTRCMVSTNAFGMGIDKADVRYVVHQRLPVSLEAYYQEAGRAGRDGKKSTAVGLWYPQDEKHMRERLEEAFPSDEEVQRVYSALMHHFALPAGSGAERFFPFDADAFAQAFRIHPGLLHHALGMLELSGVLKVNDAVRIQARVRILGDYAGIYEFKVYHPEYDDVINAMLRLLPGVFDHYVPLSEKKIAMLLGRPEPEVMRQLQELSRMEQIDYLPERNKPGITLLRDHIIPLRLDKVRIAAIRNNRLEALQAVFDYVNTPGCRMQYLRRYFGEVNAQPCGHCDRCAEAAGKEQKGSDTRAMKLAECLRLAGSLAPAALMEQAGVDDEDYFRQVVKEWMQRGLVSLNEMGWLKWKGSASA
jgi:ATP-dependent DNA helicase RecQ